MKRQIIEIDEQKCTGCGICTQGCHEGALQIINGKAVLISDLLCDGLGACVGDCPEGAITVTEREAEPYNEEKVMQHLVTKGFDVVVAHLKHLKEHNEKVWLDTGLRWLQLNSSLAGFDVNAVVSELQVKVVPTQMHHHGGSCPGSAHREMKRDFGLAELSSEQPSTLEQWPVQMHLINPQSSSFTNADLLLAADCVAFSLGNFHGKWLKGKKLAIACPKLDQGKEVYVEKLKVMIDVAKVNTITVMMMEVPCCHSLLNLVQLAINDSERTVPVKKIVVGIDGAIQREEWVSL
ncbi:MAG: 4Fe-4S ferredoxin [Bacteroidetes bacterium HGW-Bacteroidetes-6]|jgi:ferredoxin|nr:MAG: 4Fe-4S ferredoxin [Bacteroidetes bacterium HGW-Bacteroidetes-6]